MLLRFAGVCAVALSLCLDASGQSAAKAAPRARTATAKPAARTTQTPAISQGTLRAHIGFLASDALEGRDTPSRGLEAAAEYIAATFLRAGLEPKFQQVKLARRENQVPSFEVKLEAGDQSIVLTQADAAIRAPQGLEINGEEAVRLNSMEALRDAEIEGKVVLANVAASPMNRFYIAQKKPRLVIYSGERPKPAPPMVLDPGEPLTTGIISERADVEKLVKSDVPVRVSAKIPPPKEDAVVSRNVYAILPGTDPKLKDEYVVLSAHYDHVGIKADGTGDRIYNGANDNASGTSAVLALAEAFKARPATPKRSIVFLLVTAEEQGLLGSEYFLDHPVIPVEKIVANINLEQLGRTDNKGGSTKSAALMTGYEFSELGPMMRKAGETRGVRFIEDPKNSRAFFLRSDNAAFANAGIPSATYSAAFEFPDYHGLGDEASKIDYENLALLTATIGDAVWTIANGATPPRWFSDEKDASSFAAKRPAQSTTRAAKTSPAPAARPAASAPARANSRATPPVPRSKP
jgi:hypothetical protein